MVKKVGKKKVARVQAKHKDSTEGLLNNIWSDAVDKLSKKAGL